MLDFVAKGIAKIFGTKADRDQKELFPYVGKINGEWEKLQSISDDQLRGASQQVESQIADYLKDIDSQLQELQAKANTPGTDVLTKENLFQQIDKLEAERDKKLEVVLLEVLPITFAIVKETARRLAFNHKLEVTASEWDIEMAKTRPHIVIENGKATWKNTWSVRGHDITWNMVHYDVQLMGGVVLHTGKIAEMATGEGKTLVATLPAFLNGLARRSVHIVTVNDYLAKRDSEWNAPLFEFHGLKVDCIDRHDPHSVGRKDAYKSDIIYGTNNEFGFDYLRDNMVRDPDEMVQRKLHYAMVDEVDSVLVDDARTPLIISGPMARGDRQDFEMLKPRISRLVEEQKALVNKYLNEAKKALAENREKDAGLPLFRAHRGLPKNKPLIKILSETGNKALLQKTENFYLQDNQKMMPEADKELFFTIDEKNNSIDLTEKGIDFITKEGEDVTFFILPDIGTEVAALENNKSLSEADIIAAKDQIINDYSEKSQRIHTVQQLLKAYTLFEKEVEYILVEGKVKIVDEQTGRVMEGRRYSDGLHQAIEAKENVKVEDATQTYATITLQNYFRMYHKLAGMTGTAETEAGEFWQIYKLDVVGVPTHQKVVRKDEQDKVYKTVREKFNAVVDEIQDLTKKGRPVLVGTTSVEMSELISRMLKLRNIQHNVLNAKYHQREAEIVAEAGNSGTVTIATNMAGRGTDIKLTPESKAAGGLAIIGTERHESRRVDRQLRGRSGRQGDPGSSVFFVSLEDNLMRLFGSDRIIRLMDRMGIEEGEVIQHSMITNSIERAQKKVEENNFGIRKRLLEYDDVMNSQREVIYKRRKNALFGERIQLDILTILTETAENLVDTHKTGNNFEDFQLQCFHLFGFVSSLEKAEFLKQKPQDVFTHVHTEVLKNYSAKNKKLIEQTMPVFRQIAAEHAGNVEEIMVPVTDGTRYTQVPVSLAKVLETEGQALIREIEKQCTLSFIDTEWKEHLRDMDDLKQSVQNAALEQKDPLLIYKFESYNLFRKFMHKVNEDILSFLMKVGIQQDQAEEVRIPARRAPQRPQPQPKLQERKDDVGYATVSEADIDVVAQQQMRREPLKAEKIANRNDRVTVKYMNGELKKDVKYKTVEDDILAGRCMVVDIG